MNAIGRRAVDVGTGVLQDVLRRIGRRRREAVEIGRQRAPVNQHATWSARAESVKLERCRHSGQHALAIEDVEALFLDARPELVRGDVVAVRPDAHVRIVDKERRIGVGRSAEVVKIVRAERVAGHRDRDALVRCRAVGGEDGELREDPAIGEDVVLHQRVTVIVRGARSAEALEKRVAFDRPVQQLAALVVDGDLRVHPLNEVILADAAGRIGRGGVRDAGAVEIHADEVRRVSGRRPVLHDWIDRRRDARRTGAPRLLHILDDELDVRFVVRRYERAERR